MLPSSGRSVQSHAGWTTKRKGGGHRSDQTFQPLSSGALCAQTLVALCGVSGSHHCQRQLLDRHGKNPPYVKQREDVGRSLDPLR